ncbi:HDOD domain-containing protein [Vibrio sp. TH_r3]|uniref:EAL and HDOD domain-containing protein n=1 Tax=Vibrio sp. TH_r3 TaxID=3082084 RepID=UPI0029538DEE|nr:HDOD domain-containing protein [Vibrio sp. TH_r3]MDV7104660.1 HDOD domain-containing protein [Vibrio sp. TH_r3]
MKKTQKVNTETNQYTYTARQPIVDRNIEIIGYELLYRNSVRNAFPDIDSDLATRRILIEQFITRQQQILNGKLGFINFDSVSLLKKIPLDFVEPNFIIEVLETCEPNQELLDTLKELKSIGYQIALDDFVPDERWDVFYPFVDIIKFDLQVYSLDKAKVFFEKHRKFGITYIAEKVETYEEFHLAKEAGFDLFQGYFFNKPEIITNNKITSSLNTSIELCKAIADEEMDFKKIEQIISQDAVFSLQLLNFVNSSAHISAPINSFRQALAYLGANQIRKFVSYTALLAINPKKPKQLFYMSLQRAKFFELLMTKTSYKTMANEAYLCGILSLINGILDCDLDKILASLSLSESIKKALTEREGVLGLLLTLSEALEKADWGEVTIIEKKLGVDLAVIIECEFDAHLWLNDC